MRATNTGCLLLVAVMMSGVLAEENKDDEKRSLALGRMQFRPGKRDAEGQQETADKRSLALGRMQFRPGKREADLESDVMSDEEFNTFKNLLKRSLALGRNQFRPGKRSLALGRMQFRPGKRSEEEEAADVHKEQTRSKRSLAVGRADFRPGKRSLALGRVQFRPGKRSLAMGRYDFRPGKRTVGVTDQMCSIDEINDRRELMQLLWTALEEHSAILDSCQSAYGMIYEVDEKSSVMRNEDCSKCFVVGNLGTSFIMNPS